MHVCGANKCSFETLHSLYLAIQVLGNDTMVISGAFHILGNDYNNVFLVYPFVRL